MSTKGKKVAASEAAAAGASSSDAAPRNVVSAKELLAAAASATGSIEYKEASGVTFDMGLMAAFDAHPLDPAAMATDKEAALMAAATGNVQLLVKQIFELPINMTDDGPVAELPERTTRLPRWKPVPKPKPMTRWEKFAQEKGIEKRKKSRMIWDEAAQEWRPRWGYKRAGDDSKDWAVPVKTGEDAFADPWEQRKLAKKDRVIRNQLAHVKNLERATKAADRKKGIAADASAGAAPVPAIRIEGQSAKAAKAAAKGGKDKGARAKPARSSSGALLAPRVSVADGAAVPGSVPSGIPARLSSHAGMGRDASAVVDTAGGHKAKRRRVEDEGAAAAGGAGKGGAKGTGHGVKEGKAVKADRLKLAQVSTASMGKFDRKVSDEPVRPKSAAKRKRLPNETPASDEARRSADILRRVLGGSGEGERAAAGGVPSSRGGAAAGGAGGGGGGGGKQLSGGKRRRPGK